MLSSVEIEQLLPDLSESPDLFKVKQNLVNHSQKILFSCSKHGLYLQRISDHLAGKGCRLCSRTNLTSQDKQILLSTDNDYKSLLNDTINSPDYTIILSGNFKSRDYITFNCPIHGYYRQQVYQHINGHRCPKCARELKHKNKRLSNLNSDISYQTLLTDTIGSPDHSKIINAEFNSKSKILFNCPKHGLYYQSVGHHLQGQSCPSCSKLISSYGSSIESDLIKLFSLKGLKFYKTRGLIKSPVTNSPMELDLYNPDLRIAVEVNGLYYHSLEYMTSHNGYYTPQNSPIYYHQMKSRLCEQSNITLFHYFDGQFELSNFVDYVINYNSNLQTSKFIILNRAIQPITPYLSNGYKIISESEPTPFLRTIGKETLHIYDAGTVSLNLV